MTSDMIKQQRAQRESVRKRERRARFINVANVSAVCGAF